ncbi:MAG: hypothetical protein ACO3PR_09285, partial [Limisphaerales bacterium]
MDGLLWVIELPSYESQNHGFVLLVACQKAQCLQGFTHTASAECVFLLHQTLENGHDENGIVLDSHGRNGAFPDMISIGGLFKITPEQ